MNGYHDGATVKFTRTRLGYACVAKLFNDRVYFCAYKGELKHYKDIPYDPKTWDNEFYEFCKMVDAYAPDMSG